MGLKHLFIIFFLPGWLLSASIQRSVITVSGKVTLADSSMLAGTSIIAMLDGTATSIDQTGINGNYSLSFSLNANIQCIDIFLYGFGIDTTYITSYYPSFAKQYLLDIKLPKQYRKFGQVECPKCKNTNEVYPIAYGLAVEEVRIQGPDTIYSRIHKGRYSAFTCVFNEFSPRYYCDRDKIKF